MTAIIRKDGTYWEPSQEQILKWQALYPAVDVYQELNAMAGWCDANPSKRKTRMGQFCNSWLNRAQQNGGKSPFAPEKKNTTTVSTREMTSLDDLSHLFLDTPEIREHFLNKFGQYFINGERHTR